MPLLGEIQQLGVLGLQLPSVDGCVPFANLQLWHSFHELSQSAFQLAPKLSSVHFKVGYLQGSNHTVVSWHSNRDVYVAAVFNPFGVRLQVASFVWKKALLHRV